MVWLNDRLSQRGEGGNFLVQMISTCLPSRIEEGERGSAACAMVTCTVHSSFDDCVPLPVDGRHLRSCWADEPPQRGGGKPAHQDHPPFAGRSKLSYSKSLVAVCHSFWFIFLIFVHSFDHIWAILHHHTSLAIEHLSEAFNAHCRV